LLEPRRLTPVLLVSAALVVAQGSFGGDPLAAPQGALLCLAFVLLAPVSWRILVQPGVAPGQVVVRLALYAAVGTAVVLVLASVLPDLVGMGPTLVRQRGSMVVCLALFLVGGWGLARDIDFDDRLRAAEGRALEAARAAERAELLALRAHLDPHFLFNTLNAIAEWCRQDGQVAERAVLALSAMLRAILTGVRAPSWPLDTEVGLVRALFELYQLRDDQLYRLELQLPEPLPPVQVPPLLLLPLAENAIKHGPAAGHRGAVKLTVLIDDPGQRLTVRLENAGPFAGERDGGEGLRMVRKRLALAYPPRSAALDIRGMNGGTVTELTLPFGPRPETPT
jgi:hypothetical protein